MNLYFNKEWGINMKRYETSYLKLLKVDLLDTRLLNQIGLPKLSSFVQDCFIPLKEFYLLEHEKLSYLVFAQCSDLFPDRAFIAYEKKNYSIAYFFKNQEDELEKRYVNSTLTNFIRSRSTYEKFKFEARILYEKIIIEKKKYIDDAFFTSSVIKLFKNLITDLHKIEEESFQNYFQYWPNLLMDIPMNYTNHFQYIDEEFKIINLKN